MLKPKTSVRWNDVAPWVVVVLALSCGARTAAPVAPPPAAAPAAALPDRIKAKSVETDEIILRAKDGTPRGKLTAEGLTLEDPSGNKVTIDVTEAARITVTGKGGAYKLAMTAEGDLAAFTASGAGNMTVVGIEKDAASMELLAGKRRLAAGVEVTRPLADFEAFDDKGKRRMSIGLNSNGVPRFSLYDENETRRIYGILDGDRPTIDLNDAKGEPAVEVFAGDPKEGAGMAAFHAGKAAAVYGVGPDGKRRKP